MNHDASRKNEFIFLDECKGENIVERFALYLSQLIYDFGSLVWWSAGFSPSSGMISTKKNIIRAFFFSSGPSLKELGKSIGIDSYKEQKILRLHEKREAKFMLSMLALYILFLIFYASPLVLSYDFISDYIGGAKIIGLMFEEINILVFFMIMAWTGILAFIGLFISLISSTISMRLIGRIIDNFFAESHCIRELIYILIDLNRYDAVHNPRIKIRLLNRIEHFSMMTLLIPSRYQNNEINKSWMDRHFWFLSLHIKERGRWLSAPSQNTIIILRNDFRDLLNIYISGQYGKFEWANIPTSEIKTKVNKKDYFPGQLYRFLGVFIPLVLIIIYAIYIQSNQGIYSENLEQVAIIFISWLLIYIDISLNLGVTESLLNLIKNVRG
ncbi:MAG: hypothetical protein AAGH78_08765 [Cyanobacteria bacterium P01_H01_bin.58]